MTNLSLLKRCFCPFEVPGRDTRSSASEDALIYSETLDGRNFACQVTYNGVTKIIQNYHCTSEDVNEEIKEEFRGRFIVSFMAKAAYGLIGIERNYGGLKINYDTTYN